MRKPIVGLAGALVLIAASARAADQTYEIHLTRSIKIGEKIDHVIRQESTRKVHVESDGQMLNDNTEKTIVEYSATEETQAIDSMGRNKTILVTIKKLKSGDGSAPTAELVPADTQITVDYKDTAPTFTRKDNVEVSSELESALKDIFESHSETKTDDDIFGTPDKHKIGDSWPINSELVAKDMQDLKLDPKDVKGSTTLKGLTKLNGADALQYVATLEATNFDIPGIGPSPAGKIVSSIESVLPVDPSINADKAKIDLHVHGVFQKVVNGTKMVLTIDVTRTRNASSTPIK